MTHLDDRAIDAMNGVEPALANEFMVLVHFLRDQPGLAPAIKNTEFLEPAYLATLARRFQGGRALRAPSPPTTIPDPMVSTILRDYFSLPARDLARAATEHLYSMAAENIVGDLLERYIYESLGPSGWVWCSGAVVKAVDFIRPSSVDGQWIALQVKNRDNSENSSSSAIRQGTEIKKWYRTKSRTGETMWHLFPDLDEAFPLSEEGFQEYVAEYSERVRWLR